MKGKHTPGAERAARLLAQGGVICTVEGVKNEEQIADLIDRETAAPELLEACKAAVAELELLEQDEHISACQCLSRAPDDIAPPPICTYHQARTAIAKAERKEPC